MNSEDLNKILIPDSNSDGVALGDWDMGHDVKVHFRDLKSKLLKLIDSADYVFGCVAWLTDEELLDALRSKAGVSLIVQKEDFLRPDSPGTSHVNKQRLRDAYDALPGIWRHHFGVGVGHLLSHGGDTWVEGVRCVGFDRRKPFAPVMHHKFALFAKRFRGRQWEQPAIAWTGSYNWTRTANRSLENAVVIRDPKAVKGFYLEYQQLLGLSEPLDWTSEWVAPEWRIGT